MIIYHGSQNIIEKPIYHGGKEHNDYGYGFYCTENIELAKEWSCINNDINGNVNKYEINTEGLKVLDLTKDEYSILNWIAILLKFRQFETSSEISQIAKEYLINNFYIDVETYDIVIGYRADDSYFRYAKDFINNTISINKLSKAMALGELGIQVVLISEKAHNEIKYVSYESVNQNVYYQKRVERENKARVDYKMMVKQGISGLYVKDIIEKGYKNGDKIV